MVEITIAGILVSFPKDPYQCQVAYMEKNITALKNASNALLESPTGTGKTLCLLCSSLAWQKFAMSSPLHTQLSYSNAQSIAPITPKEKLPSPKSGNLIIYASRTHSQISQVVKELRSTVYRPRMTVMGSRDQLCIHEKISKLKGGALNHACNTLSSSRGCTYKNNLEGFGGALGDEKNLSRPVLDIEELVQVGRNHRVCPYFYSRDVSTNSEMVLLPYNYLMDSSIRKSLKLAWQDSVIIFDEAHNLEKVASDAASFSFTSTDIATCITELQQVLTILRDDAEIQRQSGKKQQDEEDKKPNIVVGPGDSEGAVIRPKMQAIADILTAIFKLEQIINDLPLTKGGVGTTPSVVLPGNYLRDALVEVGISMHRNHVEEMRRAGNLLMEKAEDAMGTFDGAGGGGAAMLSVTVPTLMEFASAVERVFRAEKNNQYGDYKVYVSEEEVKPSGGSGSYGSNNNSGSYHSNKGNDINKYKGYNSHGGGRVSISGGVGGSAAVSKKRVINYWCFSPGIAMEELKALGVRSIILTSGTLSPMGALREDMKLPFAVSLENPHVIGKNQMWVGALTSGPRNKVLTSVYANRESTDYKDELGLSILAICQTMLGRGGSRDTQTSTCLVPRGQELKGGVLVFFPSYSAMEGFVAHWRQSGLYDTLRNIVGAIIVEPKGSTGRPTAGMEDSKTHGMSMNNKPQPKGFMTMNTGGTNKKGKDIDGGDEQEDATVQGVLGEFEAAMRRFGGCVLMAVCRGKVSEGIDFSNNKGRVVIVTGIPFAPFMDPWVVLKKQYLDEKCGLGVSTSNTTTKINTSSQPTLSSYSGYVKSEPANPYAYPPPPVSSTSAMHTGASSNMAPLSSGNMWSSSGAKPTYPPLPSQQQPQHLQQFQQQQQNGTTGKTGYYGASAAITPMNTMTNAPLSMPPPAVSTDAMKMSSAISNVKKGTLTGQMWYNQSASRAVNQCLGRVIRHQKDWGAVFLLDNRFQQDSQNSQLSGWMRPSLQKFQQFGTALGGFRSFLTVAMNDPALLLTTSDAPAVRVSNMVVHANPQIVPQRRVPAVDGDGSERGPTIERQLSIGEYLLSEETGNNYIDPELLRTQQSEQVKNSGNNSVSSRTENRSAVTLTSASFAGNGGLMSAIDKMKAPPVPSSSNAAKITKPAFGLSAHQQGIDLSSFTQSNDDMIGSASQGLVGDSDPVISSTQNSSYSNSKVKQEGSHVSLPTSRHLSTSALSQLSSQSSQQDSESSKLNEFRDFVGEMKKLLPAATMTKLRQLVVTAKENKLNLISKVKAFVENVHALLSSLDVDKRSVHMLKLRCLVEKSLHNTFTDLVMQICRVTKLAVPVKSSSQQSVLVVKDEDENVDTTVVSKKKISRNCISDGNGSIQNEEVLTHSSKRAKSMLSAISSSQNENSRTSVNALLSQNATHSNSGSVSHASSSSSKRPDFLSSLSEVSALELTRHRVVAGGKLGTSSKLKCGVCLQVPTNPCAGRCGHISCEQCLLTWMKTTEHCPYCREPCSIQTVTRLNITQDRRN